MQLLESRIKNEIIEKRQLVRALSNTEDNKPSYEPLPSMCVACGASTFEVWITLPKWAAQVFFLLQSFNEVFWFYFSYHLMHTFVFNFLFCFALLVIHFTLYV